MQIGKALSKDFLGFDCGPPRLPMQPADEALYGPARKALKAAKFIL